MTRTARAARRHHRFDTPAEGIAPESGPLPCDSDGADPAAYRGGWMPRAYLAFKASHRSRVYEWSTRGAATGGSPHYPFGLRRRLCDDVGRSLPVYAW